MEWRSLKGCPKKVAQFALVLDKQNLNILVEAFLRENLIFKDIPIPQRTLLMAALIE